MNLFFKSAFLIVAICGVVILFGIYSKKGDDRFKIQTTAEGVTRAIDTKTGTVYFYGGAEGWFVIGDGGERLHIKNPFD